METNLRVLEDRDPASPSLTRLAEACSRLLGQQPAAPREAVTAAAAWVRDFCRRMEIPTLSSFGLGEDDLVPLAAAARRASSMKANPVSLTEAEVVGIIRAAL